MTQRDCSPLTAACVWTAERSLTIVVPAHWSSISWAESNYGGILIDGGVTLDLHGCPLTIGTLILADGVLDLDCGRPSPSARMADGVRLTFYTLPCKV